MPTGTRKNRRKLNKKSHKVDHDVANPDAVDEEIADEEMKDDRATEETAETSIPMNISEDVEDEDLMIEMDVVPSTSALAFPPLPASAGQTALKSEMRRIAIPPHRMTPLKKDWVNIFGPLTEMLGLQVRMNVQRKCVEVRVRCFCNRQQVTLS